MNMSLDFSADRADARLATRLAFFAAGFATACWAPLVPFAKERVGLDDQGSGFVLLCLRIGSLMAMPLTGWLSTTVGAKPMILLGGMGLVLFLPFLAVADTPVALAGALLAFGASLGTIDVAMNVHALEDGAGRAAPTHVGLPCHVQRRWVRRRRRSDGAPVGGGCLPRAARLPVAP